MKDIKVGKSSLMRVRAEEILVDDSYQRQCFDEVRARRIGREYDERRFGFPLCSRRGDGKLYVVDGQHRVRGVVLEGYGSRVIAVHVVDGLSVEEEAELFWLLNGSPDRSRGVKAYDNYRARLCFGEASASEVDAIVAGVGLRVGPAPSTNVIAAVTAMERAHARNGNLADTVKVLRGWSNAIGGGGKAYDGKLLGHVSDFLADYADVDHGVLVRKLARLLPGPIADRIKLQTTAFGGDETKREVANTVLVAIYNRGNRGKKLKRAA